MVYKIVCDTVSYGDLLKKVTKTSYMQIILYIARINGDLVPYNKNGIYLCI